MNMSEFTANTDIKDTLIQISDCISELDILIGNINVHSEEIYTSLSNQIALTAEGEQSILECNTEVSKIKSGMIREFVIRANEKISDLINSFV